MVEGFLFDLDGVITDTAKLHYRAWKKMAQKLEIEIDEEFNEKLKGIDRRSSLERILEKGNKKLTEDEKIHWMNYKNDYYVSLLKDITEADILPGILELLREAKKNSVKIAVASASKNAPIIINKLGIEELIDYVASPDEAKNSKPDPAIFILAAKGINVEKEKCISFEDSEAGIEAIRQFGSFSIGVNVDADVTFYSTSEIIFENIKDLV